MSNVPQVSAIIPTRDRPDMLRRAIASALNSRNVDFELLVIDQSDGTASEQIAKEFGGSVRYIRTDTRGVSKARNLGASLARAEILAYTDDDCEVPPGWLHRAVELMRDFPEASLCHGDVIAAPELHSPSGAVPALHLGQRRLVGGIQPYELAGMTANLVVRRSVFEQLGGFDEKLGPGGELKSSEDFDLQFRAHRLKRSTLLEPDLKVVHYGFRDSDEWRRLFWRDGVGVGAFYMKHVRLWDGLAARGLIKLLAAESLRAGKAILVRRDPARVFFLGAIFVGAFQSFRYPVDRKTRRYGRRLVREPGATATAQR